MKDTIIFILVSIFGLITFFSVIATIFMAADCRMQSAENIVILEELCSIKPDYHYCKRIKGANQWTTNT